MGIFEFFEYIAVFQIVTDILEAIVGVGMIFGALKWRRGLVTTTAFYWGAFIGLILGLLLADSTGELTSILVCVIIGAILFPILAYTVPGINRFVIGFIVVTKISFMISTEIVRNGTDNIAAILIMPLIIGAIGGIAFAGWTRVPISAFVTACAFFGAMELAPVVSKYFNQLAFGITHDINFLFDPLDFIFSLVGIELTDMPQLITCLICIPIGIYYHYQSVKAQGYSFSTPLIVFETDNPNDHGEIFPEKDTTNVDTET